MEYTYCQNMSILSQLKMKMDSSRYSDYNLINYIIEYVSVLNKFEIVRDYRLV